MPEIVTQLHTRRKPPCTCGVCQKCKRRAYNQKYYAAHNEALRARSVKYYEENTEEARAYNRRQHKVRSFGVSPQEYNAQLAWQGGVCARCGKAETALDNKGTGRVRALAIDHCHKTLRLRSLLCSSCNTRIGGRESNLEEMLGDLLYLVKHESPVIEILRTLFSTEAPPGTATPL